MSVALLRRVRWPLAVLPLSLLLLLPLSLILLSVLDPDPVIWRHLLDYLLPELLGNTAYLVFGVAAGVLLLGVPLAWLVAVHEFPGRRWFNWALLLPLAMPAYVLAFTQIGLFDFTGPLQTLLRSHFPQARWFPPVRSMGGLIVVMSLAFYPYVYLLARNAFASMGRRALEAGQMLGLSRRAGFVRIALPMARPWLAGGVLLALMEALADFGTVSVFNVDVFSTAIYKAWFSLFSLPTAQQLASLLVALVLLLLWLEQRQRGRRAYVASGRAAEQPRLPLSGAAAWLACGFAALVLTLAFILPFIQLLVWSWQALAQGHAPGLFGDALRTLALGLLAAVLVVAIALWLSYARRRDGSLALRVLLRIATVGYAVPGTVLALAIFVPVAWLDNVLIGWWLPGQGVTAILKGTLLVMVLAYVARFLAVGHAAVDAAMQRISVQQEAAARSLGHAGFGLWRRLHLPLLRGGVLSGLLLVLVEVMKEMPITMMTRPFGWDTLAVRIYGLTSEGQFVQAALPSVLLLLAGLGPTLLLSRQKDET